MDITGVVITHNEEKNIVRCLKSLDFCQEIIVVDSQSTDQTAELARKFTDKVFSKAWAGYTEQKNYATGLATSEWVINLDADEEVSAELRGETEGMLKKGGVIESAFSVPRKTLHFGKWIRYGGWYPNYLVRLYRPAQGKWVGEELHERWETGGAEGPLQGHIIHHSFTSIADQVRRNNRYSCLGAQRLMKEGKKFSLLGLLTKPISKFAETYVLKKGFLDGYPGFIISVSAAYSVFLKWAKLWELEKKASHG